MSSSNSNLKPLHNFSLKDLKWPKNHSSNQLRGRRPLDLASPHQTSSLTAVEPFHSPMPSSSSNLASLLQSPPVANAATPLQSPTMPLGKYPLSENRKTSSAESTKKVTTSSSFHSPIKKLEKNISQAADMDEPMPNANTCISLRITSQVPKEEEKLVKDKSLSDVIPKRWNLRPRKPLNKKADASCSSKIDGEQNSKASLAYARERGKALEKEIEPPKPKFSVSLTREEIEQDFIAMTGAKPSRKPKKRNKNVQKELDNLFPGNWLASVNSDEYKAAEALLKGFSLE